MGLWLAMMVVAAPQVVAEISNGSIRARAVRSGGEIVEELAAKDQGGVYRTILVSATHPSLGARYLEPKANLLRGSESGLFDSAPTFRFSSAKANGRTLTFVSSIGDWTVTKQVALPAKGTTAEVTLHADTGSPYPQIRYLLSTYAFAPGKPDETFAPGLRPMDGDVIGDHFFRSPAAILRKGRLAATVMPDLDVLRENRPIPTILDLDVKSGVVAAPLVSYGFCDYRLAGHVRFSHDASMVRPTPWELTLRSQIRLDADATPGSPVSAASNYMWARYGHANFGKILPQTMPFADYARLCYPAAFHEKDTGGWFEHDLNGHIVGGLPSGWGLGEGWVSYQCWFNQLRSAWGLHWWGKRLGEKDWVDKSEKMLNLALAAPGRGVSPTTYMSRTKTWKGSLVSPSSECYYDIPSLAWKGIWFLRWLKFDDCPHRAEVEKRVKDIHNLMLRVQRADGSFPSWLTRDLKVVPLLDRSAQSALPAWFLSEVVDFEIGRLIEQARSEKSKSANGLSDVYVGAHESEQLEDECEHVIRASTFIYSQVIPKHLYYDFETFFSCSPKTCLQAGGIIDDPRMWDPHSWQPPQNNLSMQWSAEALFRAKSFSEPYLNCLLGEKAKYVGGSVARSPFSALAMTALDTMNLYQTVWPISYRKVAYTYGGFGVQNSDGEYNDARQSQFGATLCDFGAQLDRRDLFERGVAAVRASLTLVNNPNDPFHLYPNPNYPVGLEPENDGHGGTDEQNGRSGFDWAEGSGLAGAAELLDKYGEIYHGNGWSVKIDAVPTKPVSPAPLVDPSFSFTDWRMPGWEIEGTFLHWPTQSKRRNFGSRYVPPGGGEVRILPFIGTAEDGRGGFDDTYTGTMTSPRFCTKRGEITLLVGGGSGKDVGVELLDDEGKQVQLAHGGSDEMMHWVTWKVSGSGPYRIRIFDRETGPWGHINVGFIQT
ncbi:hypothetical protein [Fimbriimonas ginsengisoli]|uniref:Uncharacterized protein n=1 Tax=Fimbriimonas ginsengisoli Gsoil 348 TaxID=661478 RepID=A0A068NTB5_FIMGI|nr:hypothetical protein [Fimbriimonas ginsengisoli]AIE84869.1 hypothetical protein OP10G_1501 [Fimbriimonas ginsengisoli Gsoil 348]